MRSSEALSNFQVVHILVVRQKYEQTEKQRCRLNDCSNNPTRHTSSLWACSVSSMKNLYHQQSLRNLQLTSQISNLSISIQLKALPPSHDFLSNWYTSLQNSILPPQFTIFNKWFLVIVCYISYKLFSQLSICSTFQLSDLDFAHIASILWMQLTQHISSLSGYKFIGGKASQKHKCICLYYYIQSTFCLFLTYSVWDHLYCSCSDLKRKSSSFHNSQIFTTCSTIHYNMLVSSSVVRN